MGQWQECTAGAPSGNGFSMGNIITDAVKAPFTSVVFILCVAVYLLSLFGLFAPIAQHLLMQPFYILSQNHEWWRLLGPAFIHFSALHIIFNLLWWGMLGAKIERTWHEYAAYCVLSVGHYFERRTSAI